MMISSKNATIKLEDAKKDKKTHITIKIQSERDNDIIYRVKRDAPLSRVMYAYCDHLNLEYDVMRFFFDGKRIEEFHTADVLQMIDDDIIDATMYDQKEKSTHITIKVQRKHEDDKFLRIKRDTPLSRLKHAYCDRLNLQYSAICFFFHGQRVKDFHTVDLLKLKEGDTIDANDQKETSTNYVTIKVQMEQQRDISFTIERDAPLGKLMRDYCDRLNLEYGVIRFLYEGKRIKDYHTADELEMAAEDSIDAMDHMIGGSANFRFLVKPFH